MKPELMIAEPTARARAQGQIALILALCEESPLYREGDMLNEALTPPGQLDPQLPQSLPAQTTQISERVAPQYIAPSPEPKFQAEPLSIVGMAGKGVPGFPGYNQEDDNTKNKLSRELQAERRQMARSLYGKDFSELSDAEKQGLYLEQAKEGGEEAERHLRRGRQIQAYQSVVEEGFDDRSWLPGPAKRKASDDIETIHIKLAERINHHALYDPEIPPDLQELLDQFKNHMINNTDARTKKKGEKAWEQHPYNPDNWQSRQRAGLTEKQSGKAVPRTDPRVDARIAELREERTWGGFGKRKYTYAEAVEIAMDERAAQLTQEEKDAEAQQKAQEKAERQKESNEKKQRKQMKQLEKQLKETIKEARASGEDIPEEGTEAYHRWLIKHSEDKS